MNFNALDNNSLATQSCRPRFFEPLGPTGFIVVTTRPADRQADHDVGGQRVERVTP